MEALGRAGAYACTHPCRRAPMQQSQYAAMLAGNSAVLSACACACVYLCRCVLQCSVLLCTGEASHLASPASADSPQDQKRSLAVLLQVTNPYYLCPRTQYSQSSIAASSSHEQGVLPSPSYTCRLEGRRIHGTHLPTLQLKWHPLRAPRECTLVHLQDAGAGLSADHTGCHPVLSWSYGEGMPPSDV